MNAIILCGQASISLLLFACINFSWVEPRGRKPPISDPDKSETQKYSLTLYIFQILCRLLYFVFNIKGYFLHVSQ